MPDRYPRSIRQCYLAAQLDVLGLVHHPHAPAAQHLQHPVCETFFPVRFPSATAWDCRADPWVGLAVAVATCPGAVGSPGPTAAGGYAGSAHSTGTISR